MSKELLTTDQIKIIRDIVEIYFKVDLRRKTTKKPYPDARKIYSMLCHKHTVADLLSIGNEINRSHSSVISHIDSGSGLLVSDRDFAINFNRIDAKIPKFKTNISKISTRRLQHRLGVIKAEMDEINKELSERMK